MPPSCCTPDYDAAFDARSARRQALAYRRSGAGGSTLRLLNAIRETEVAGAAVLDIGGGIGVIGLELLAAGAASLTSVDASRPSVAVAKGELQRAGLADRATVRHGDFVELAGEIEAADVVTLDRVVCCYGDWRALVDASVSHARRVIGLVYPNERWWMRAGIGIGNLMLRLVGQSFRGYVHPERAIDDRIRRAGFERRTHHRGWLWQTVLYERAAR
ncbi:MAG TPA: methyltransferase domain-containing protein [Candidatus Binatia bacterium]|nr:methyltransferase domain-containing protein [Candidatus Binatia bacterium]